MDIDSEELESCVGCIEELVGTRVEDFIDAESIVLKMGLVGDVISGGDRRVVCMKLGGSNELMKSELDAEEGT